MAVGVIWVLWSMVVLVLVLILEKQMADAVGSVIFSHYPVVRCGEQISIRVFGHRPCSVWEVFSRSSLMIVSRIGKQILPH